MAGSIIIYHEFITNGFDAYFVRTGTKRGLLGSLAKLSHLWFSSRIFAYIEVAKLCMFDDLACFPC